MRPRALSQVHQNREPGRGLPSAQSSRSSDRSVQPVARRLTPIADLGPGRRDVSPPRDRERDWDACLLLSSGEPVATAQQREHERAPARLLPQGHEPARSHPRGPRPRQRPAQSSAPQSARLANTSRPVQYTPNEPCVATTTGFRRAIPSGRSYATVATFLKAAGGLRPPAPLGCCTEGAAPTSLLRSRRVPAHIRLRDRANR